MPSPVDRLRFSRFVERALADARGKGLTDVQIERATGIRASTFHRWRRGEVAPTVDKVRQFCAGLGIPAKDALAALGIGARESTPPIEVSDPDVNRFLQMLADPDVPPAKKQQIRAILQGLVDLADRQPPKRRRKAS